MLVLAYTSFFIHHADKVEDLDLRPTLNIREDSIHLLIPMAVIDQLDDLKQSKDTRARWRSRHTLAELDRVLPDPTSPGRLRAEDFSGLYEGTTPRGELTVEIVFDHPGQS